MTLTLDIPANLEEHLRRETPDLDAEARIAVALDWFRTEKIGISQLAKILGMTRWEAKGLLKTRGETAQMITHEELAQQVEATERLLQACGR